MIIAVFFNPGHSTIPSRPECSPYHSQHTLPFAILSRPAARSPSLLPPPRTKHSFSPFKHRIISLQRQLSLETSQSPSFHTRSSAFSHSQCILPNIGQVIS